MDMEPVAVETSRFPEVAAHIRQRDDAIATGLASTELSKIIELEISELEAASLQLRASRNACQPLLRLPAEILGEIAEILTVIWPPRNGYSTLSRIHSGQLEGQKARLQLGWVLLGHVSRKLRRTLLSRHDLWAGDICNISRLPDILLPYCRDAPLHIEVSKLYESLRETGPPATWIDFITKHITSSRVISIQESGRWNDDSLFANLDPSLFLTAPLPHLTQLSLTLRIFPRDDIPALTADVLELPEMVAPQLRSLHLTNYLLPFKATTLTSLALEFVRPTYPFTPSTFLDIISQCHSLRSLRLIRCITQLSLDASEVLSLPSLEDMYLIDTIHRCIGLLRHTKAPSSTFYHVFCTDIQTEYQESSLYFADMIQCFQTRIGASTTGIKVEVDGWQCSFSLHEPGTPEDLPASYTETGPFCDNHREQMLCYFSILRFEEPQFSYLMYALPNTVNFAVIQTLHISNALHESYGSAFWTAALSPFSNLTTLYLENMPRTAALLALSSSIPGQDVVLPRLRYLWLGILDTRDTQTGHDVEGPDGPGFLRMLSSRMRGGRPLERLRIEVLLATNPGQTTKRFIPRLKTLVSQVEVMGVQERDPVTEDEPVSDSGGSEDEGEGSE